MAAGYDDAQRWLVLRRGRLRIAASLGERPAALPLGAPGTAVLAATSPAVSIEGEQLSMPPAAFAVVAT
jgi:maltooligosyltrehalose trehalohydrolase